MDAAAGGLNVIHSEMVGNVKVSAVFGTTADVAKERSRYYNVDVSPVPVQKLFIFLTGNGSEFCESNREGLQ
ncbi:MAG TPA: hypothetical protein PK127_06835 [Clostridiales bacterium]|nr:hypothetical protein [Clostridiales bacterium]HPV02175.1 hypothetical protein [Clostridiales bacterium]